jgi:hypothetical protein
MSIAPQIGVPNMTRPGSPRISASMAALLFLAISPLAGHANSDSVDYVSVLAHHSCAPWDGPAVAIEFYTSPTRCGQGKSARLSINLWRNLPLKSGQKFELSHATSVGAASLCVKEGQCEAAESGTVWIEEFDSGKSVSGHYEFKFRKAGQLAGKFRASWCEIRQMCR